MIERLILPKRLSRTPQNCIRRPRRSTLDVHQSFAKLYLRPQKNMDMVSHNYPRQ